MDSLIPNNSVTGSLLNSVERLYCPPYQEDILRRKEKIGENRFQVVVIYAEKLQAA
jgi:hypothetical protein